MEIMLSQTVITSFVGNVMPLRLLGVAEYAMEDITWTVSDPCVQLTSFEKAESEPFTDGVLLTFLKAGTAQVTATYQGNTYCCQISVRERMCVPSQKGLSYYVASFHDHTAQTHNRVEFPLRKETMPMDYLQQIREEGMLDGTAISDHADLLNDREFFRGFWDASQVSEKELVIFPGAEAEVTPLGDDRYGVQHKLGGEIVTMCADSYASTGPWADFFARYRTSPFAIGILAHPQIVGYSRKGIWNFCLDKNRDTPLRPLLRGVEMGDGSDQDSNLINEHVYSVALDNGYQVSTTCSADRHGPVWGGKQYPGKTIVMAPEKSKEAFMDALDNCRFYASESGNVKIYYEVNGQPAPAKLALQDTYSFRVELELLEENLGGMPVRLQVISDYGKTLWETEDVRPEMEFSVESNTARWFYLRLTDENGKRTWSVPVWTGREIDPLVENKLEPLPKTGFAAVEEISGQCADVLLCDDPAQTFSAEGPVCSILVDMGRPQSIGALGLYHFMLNMKAVRTARENNHNLLAELPVRYQVETGLEKDTMTLRAEGLYRVFGAEELAYFPVHEARFVRLRILSNAGKESGRPAYQNSQTQIAELTLYN